MNQSSSLVRCFYSLLENAELLMDEMSHGDLFEAFNKVIQLQIKIMQIVQQSPAAQCQQCKHPKQEVKPGVIPHYNTNIVMPNNTSNLQSDLSSTIHGLHNDGQPDAKKSKFGVLRDSHSQLKDNLLTKLSTFGDPIKSLLLSTETSTSALSAGNTTNSDYPGRQKLGTIVQSHWNFQVCLLPSPRVETTPADEEVTQWSECGMGLVWCRVPNLITMPQLRAHLCSLFPRVPQLANVGFDICCDIKDGNITALECKDTRQLKVLAGSNLLFLRPTEDLCSLPPEPELDSTITQSEGEAAMSSRLLETVGNSSPPSHCHDNLSSDLITVKLEAGEATKTRDKSPHSMGPSTEDDSAGSENSNLPTLDGFIAEYIHTDFTNHSGPDLMDPLDVPDQQAVRVNRGPCSCPHCSTVFTRRDSLYRHLGTCRDNPRRVRKRYQCTICQSVYKHMRYFREHCIMKHDTDYRLIVREVDEESSACTPHVRSDQNLSKYIASVFPCSSPTPPIVSDSS